MKSKLIVGALGSLIVVSLLLASCANTTSSTTATTASVTTVTNTTTTTSTTIPPSTTSTSSTTTAATVAATTTSTGNWWDSLGTPQYGGTMTLQSAANIVNFDPYDPGNLNGIYSAWLEPLNSDDWTVSPSVFSFNIGYHPVQFQKATWHQAGNLRIPILLWCTCVRIFTGKICRRQMVGNSLHLMW